MTTFSLEATDSLIVPLRACTPWCQHALLHPREHSEDRSCWGGETSTPITRGKIAHYTDGSYQYDRLDVRLDVRLWRAHDREETMVLLFHEADDSEVRLTLSEARMLADAISKQLAKAEQS